MAARPRDRPRGSGHPPPLRDGAGGGIGSSFRSQKKSAISKTRGWPTVSDAWSADCTRSSARARRLRRSQAVIRLTDLSYEASGLGNVLTAADLQALTPAATPLPRSMRDGDGRWRKVLAALDVGVEVGSDEAIELLEWPNEELGPRSGRWFVDLVAAALEDGLDNLLQPLPCLLLEDGGRLSPDDAVSRGLVLSKNADGNALGELSGPDTATR